MGRSTDIVADARLELLAQRAHENENGAGASDAHALVLQIWSLESIFEIVKTFSGSLVGIMQDNHGMRVFGEVAGNKLPGMVPIACILVPNVQDRLALLIAQHELPTTRAILTASFLKASSFS